MTTHRRTKVYGSRAEFDLDIQIMRAQGWVPEMVDDALVTERGSGCFSASVPWHLGAPKGRQSDRVDPVGDYSPGTRIQVTYRRA